MVTGAGKGIGRGVVMAMIKSGAHVYALTRSQADLDSLERDCEAEGKKHLVCTVREQSSYVLIS